MSVVPEYVLYQRYGIVPSEGFFKAICESKRTPIDLVKAMCSAGILVDGCSRDLATLVSRCTTYESALRPSIEGVIDFLRSLKAGARHQGVDAGFGMGGRKVVGPLDRTDPIARTRDTDMLDDVSDLMVEKVVVRLDCEERLAPQAWMVRSLVRQAFGDLDADVQVLAERDRDSYDGRLAPCRMVVVSVGAAQGVSVARALQALYDALADICHLRIETTAQRPGDEGGVRWVSWETGREPDVLDAPGELFLELEALSRSCVRL